MRVGCDTGSHSHIVGWASPSASVTTNDAEHGGVRETGNSIGGAGTANHVGRRCCAQNTYVVVVRRVRRVLEMADHALDVCCFLQGGIVQWEQALGSNTCAGGICRS